MPMVASLHRRKLDQLFLSWQLRKAHSKGKLLLFTHLTCTHLPDLNFKVVSLYLTSHCMDRLACHEMYFSCPPPPQIIKPLAYLCAWGVFSTFTDLGGCGGKLYVCMGRFVLRRKLGRYLLLESHLLDGDAALLSPPPPPQTQLEQSGEAGGD